MVERTTEWVANPQGVVWVWVFESDVPAKTLGHDAILYAVRKQRIGNVISETEGATLV